MATNNGHNYGQKNKSSVGIIVDGSAKDLFINPQLQHLARRSCQLHGRLQLVFRNLHSYFCSMVYEQTPMGSEQTDAVCHSETKPATQSPAQQKIPPPSPNPPTPKKWRNLTMQKWHQNSVTKWKNCAVTQSIHKADIMWRGNKPVGLYCHIINNRFNNYNNDLNK